MFSILKKELWIYFGSFLAYLIAGLFCILSVLFLFFFENQYNILEIGTASMNPFFQISPWFLVFLIPALTMKSVAEEENQGTLQWIFSKPIYVSSFVLGKFFAIFLVIILGFLSSLTIIYTLNELSIPKGNLDFGSILAGYFGLILLSGTFISIGIFASSLMKNQISAFLLAVFFCFIFYFGLEQLATFKLLGSFDFILQNIGLYFPFSSFVKGVLGLRETAYFLFLILLFIGLSVFSIKRKL